MAVKVKKNKRPKATKRKSISQNVRQLQAVNIHLGPKRRVGLQKVAQQPKHPQPNFSFVTNIAAPPPTDTSLLFRELFASRNAIKGPTNQFERAVAEQAAVADRAVETTVAAAAAAEPVKASLEKKPFPKPRPRTDVRRTKSEPGVTGLEPVPMKTFSLPNYGAEVTTPLTYVGNGRDNLQDTGPMSRSLKARPDPDLTLAERMRQQQNTDQFLKEKAMIDAAEAAGGFSPLVAFPAPAATAPSTIRDAIAEEYGLPPPLTAPLGRASSSGSTASSTSTLSYESPPGSPFPIPALPVPLVVPPLQIISTQAEAPDRKADGETLGAAALPKTRSLAGPLQAAKRDPGLHDEPTLADSGQTTEPDESTVSYREMTDPTARLLAQGLSDVGHGETGSLVAEEKQPTGVLSAAGKIPKKGRPPLLNTPEAIARREKDAQARAIKKIQQAAADQAAAEMNQALADLRQSRIEQYVAEGMSLEGAQAVAEKAVIAQQAKQARDAQMEQYLIDKQAAEKDYAKQLAAQKRAEKAAGGAVGGGGGKLQARLGEQQARQTPRPTPRQMLKTEQQKRSQALQDAGFRVTETGY